MGVYCGESPQIKGTSCGNLKRIEGPFVKKWVFKSSAFCPICALWWNLEVCIGNRSQVKWVFFVSKIQEQSEGCLPNEF